MNYTQEKIFYGISTMFATMFSTLGAIMTTGESRWIFVTLTVSIITAGFLALIFKRTKETITLVVGRSGIGILCGVLLSKPAVWWFKLSTVHTDIIALAGVAGACCVFGFIFGYAILKYASTKSEILSKKFFDHVTKNYIPADFDDDDET